MEQTVLQGSTVSKNRVPPMPAAPVLRLKGTFKGKPSMLGLDADTISKHMLLVGGTGCGKSTLFYHIISQIKQKMTADDVMIVFDSKGDFYSRFFSANDCVIGNSSQYVRQSKRWNIFREILADGWGDQQVLMNTQEICRTLFEERTKKNSSNPFFPNAARDLLASILVTTVRLGKNDNKFTNENFYNDCLRRMLDGSSSEDLCSYIGGEADMRSVMSYIEGDSAQSQGVLAEMFSVVRDVLMGVFAEHGMFSMRDFVRKKGGRTLFLEYDLSIGSVLTPVYRLLFDLALKEALGRTKSQGNVYLICDEFKLLPDLQHIDDGVNFGRSLGVKVFAGLQSIEQLYEIYGQSRGRNLAAGFSTVVAFRANDLTTREYVSGLYGKNMLLEEYRTMNGGNVEAKRIGSTVEDWDMNSLAVGEAIVGLPFAPPFRFYFDMYK